MTATWRDFRGIELQQIGVSSIKANEEDEERIKQIQLNATYKDPTQFIAAQANAMQYAAKNEGGATLGFMNYNMAQQAGGNVAQQLYQMGATASAAQPAGWTCPTCHAVNNGNFCTQCGAKKPEAARKVKCAKCGWEPADPSQIPNFCPNCGDAIGPEDFT